MSELIPINVVIADRTYRLKLKPEDEETVRTTVKGINDRLLEYKTHFAGKDMQDYLAMVLIWLATETTRVHQNPVQSATDHQLQNLHDWLEEELKSL